MNNLLLIIVIISIFLSSCHAFSPIAALAKKTAGIKPSSTLLAATKSTKRANPNSYWEGEWVCADCGYIYDIGICRYNIFTFKNGNLCMIISRF